MRNTFKLIGLTLVLVPLNLIGDDPRAPRRPTAGPARARFRDTVRPFLQTYCLECHGKEKPKGDLDLSAYPTLEAVAGTTSRWETVLEQLEAGAMPPAKAKRHPEAGLRREVVAWIEAFRKHEAKRNAGDPGPVLRAAAEQRRVRLHDPRPDRRRHPADARVPRRPRQRGRLRQLGGIADDVAGPGEEVPGGGAAGRRPPRPEARRASPSRRTRWSPTPTATSTACGGSSISTSGSGPTTPTISWPPGGSSTARPSASPRRRWPTSPPRPGSARDTSRRSGPP